MADVRLEIIRGSRGGLCVSLNDYRIAGGKPYMGGDVIADCKVQREDVLRALKGPVEEKPIPRDFFIEDNTEDAGITWDAFQKAIQVWSFLRQNARPDASETTVRDTAEAFCTTDQVIQEAVRDHPWMFIEGPDDDPTKQTIYHEGE